MVIIKGKEKKREEREVQITAFVPLFLKKELWKILIDEGVTYREWLTGQIKHYIKREGRSDENV